MFFEAKVEQDQKAGLFILENPTNIAKLPALVLLGTNKTMQNSIEIDVLSIDWFRCFSVPFWGFHFG